MPLINHQKILTKSIGAILLLSLLIRFSTQAQENSINNFVEKRDTSFVNINEFFKQYRRDTNQLKKILDISLKANYNEAASHAYDMLGINYRNNFNRARRWSTLEEAFQRLD